MVNKTSKYPSYKSQSTIKKIDRAIRYVKPIPAEAHARKLTSFSVTSDSVVATANITFDPSHTRIELHWGDDQTEIINIGKLRNMSISHGNGHAPNTLTFQHVYRPPFDHGRKIIIASTTDSDGGKSFDWAVIEIDPRYRLDFYSITLEFPEHLDFFGENSEVEANLSVYQHGQNLMGRAWKDSVVTNPDIGPLPGEIISWHLENSNFNFEISHSEDPIYIRLELQEDDKLLDDDSVGNILINTVWDVITSPINGAYQFVKFIGATADGFDTSALIDGITMPIEIHPRNRARFENRNGLVAEYRLWPDGKIYARLRFELNLIIPIDHSQDRLMTTS